jgi:hypothetical protein
MYTDPDGEFIQYIIGAVVGFINGLSQGAAIANAAGKTGGAKFGIMMASAGIGAGIGAATAGLGTALNFGGVAAGAITGGASGLVSGAVTGVAMGAATGQKGTDLWNTTWKGALIGMGTGIAMGGIMGGIDAAIHHKNIWLGRDIGMGRNAFSFNNSDKPATYNFIEGDRRSNYDITGGNLRSFKENSRVLARGDEWSYRREAELRNITWADYKPSRRIYVGNMKGRGYLDYSGFVQEGCELQIDFDGKNVLTLPPITGDPKPYPTTRMIIPSGTKIIDINYIGTPTIYGTPEFVTHYPFNTVIYGIPSIY